MKVFLISTYDFDAKYNFDASWLEEETFNAQFKIDSVVNDPEETYFKLFLEQNTALIALYFFKVLKNPIFFKIFLLLKSFLN